MTAPLSKAGMASHITYHPHVDQGSETWLKLRCGLLTASEMKHIITPTLKIANNGETRTHLYELAAQRITNFVEPQFQSFDMIRGQADEDEARSRYADARGPVKQVGFITNDRWGPTLGYSPDGLVSDDGLIECKSRKQKFQVQTVVEHLATGDAPAEFMIQLQTGLLVSERQWIDLVSYSEKLPMAVMRVHPDEKMQAAIVEAAQSAEVRIAKIIADYREATAPMELAA